jgi:radical SAM superfamily enzyme
LQIIKGTLIEKEFHEKLEEFEPFTFEDYVRFFITFLERLNPEIVVERFTGEAPPGYLSELIWGRRRTYQIVKIIENRLEELDTWQGRLYKS